MTDRLLLLEIELGFLTKRFQTDRIEGYERAYLILSTGRVQCAV